MPSTFDKYKTFYYFKKENETIPIVFIHGVGLTKEMWSPQINFFKDQNILTYDLIGHGKTPLEKTQLNFEDFIKQLLNLIDELELKKIHLVGFSLGSLIARHFASEHSNKLSSLVLHASIYKRSIEQKRVVENRFELMKMDKPASKKNALRRWFTEEFIKNNKEVYDKLSSKFKLGRVRILLKEPRSTLSWHRDPEPRLHIPIITNPGCIMVIENVAKHLPADGSVYITNNVKYHNAFNGGEENRVHLVACLTDYKFH